MAESGCYVLMGVLFPLLQGDMKKHFTDSGFCYMPNGVVSVIYLFAIPGSVQNKSGHNTTTLTLYYISCNWKRGKRWSSPSFVLCLVCGKIIETVAILRTF